jgi:hypothetical protein
MGPAWETGAQGGDGRIPFTFRIGVTGHRELDDPDGLRAAVRKALRGLIELWPVAPTAGLTPVVVSALAEGADRLVAEEILADPEARLEVALPLPLLDYEEDFKTEASKEEFRRLLARASAILPPPTTPSRNEAYERAGWYVVDRCDALIALWDGEDPRGQGGTAEIVAYAQENGVPIAWINTQGNPEPTYAHSYNQDSRTKVLTEAADKLRTYNARVIDSEKFGKRIQDLRDELMSDVAREIPIDPLGLSREAVANWVFPYFIRADILALRYQRRFRWLSLAIFALAAFAVGVVAVQAFLFSGEDWGAYAEALSLLILLLILWTNHRWRLRDRWISSRFLAERLRSSYFLALAGTGDQRGRPARLTYLSDSSEALIERALTEVSARRPELETGSLPVDALRDYLKQHWIDSQISYQRKASRRQGKFDDWLVAGTGTLFVLTLIAALAYSVGKSIPFLTFLHHIPEHWTNVLLVVSITVPAIGAALHGIGAQRQFRRHSERYRTMANVLEKVHADMTDATTIDQVRGVAAETEQVMREENSDWFGVMRFHDMKLIT